MKKLKQGDFVRLNNDEIPRHIELLIANGHPIWDAQLSKFKLEDNCILLDTQGEFLSTNCDTYLLKLKELSKHDWVCAVIGLEEGVGMRSDMSTTEQIRHISDELELLGLNVFRPLNERRERWKCSFYLYDDKWQKIFDETRVTHVPYSEWCKKLGIDEVCADATKCDHDSQKWCKECYEEKHDQILGISKMETTQNIITLPDGTTVDFTKPIQFRYFKAKEWLNKPDYNFLRDHFIGINNHNGKLVFYEVKQDMLQECYLRNTPEYEFVQNQPVWGKVKGIIGNVWLYGTFANTLDGSLVINHQNFEPITVSKIKPAINPDGSPNFPPFND
jgi:hypothetical protein